MKKNTDKIFSAMRYIAKTVFLFYSLWCISKTIDTALVYKNSLPNIKWSDNISSGVPLTALFSVTSVIFLTLHLFWDFDHKGTNYFNYIYSLLLHCISYYAIAISILVCAVQWPMTLTILGFVILFSVIVAIHDSIIRHKALTVMMQQIPNIYGKAEKSEKRF